MTIDYEFVRKMLAKYYKHLTNVEKSINQLIEDYTRQIENLSKLDNKKYGSYQKELEKKRAEAFKKLSNICPNMDKIAETMDLIQVEFLGGYTPETPSIEDLEK